MDLAELGIKVDSSGVTDADKALDNFSDKAKEAGDAADDFAKEADNAGKASEQMADELKKAEEGFNLIAVGIGAAVAALGTGFVMGVTDAIGRIEEETKLLAQFDKVLQNTGNTADTTADTFASFADELEDATGRAAEEILAVGANLASYGFNNEIFYSSIRLANDMSAAWGGDLRSSLEGLGRALDDPINGFAMLSKRGISLTEEQEAMVKSLVESNKEFEAQAYIIETLAEQVGGAAEAGFTGFAAAQQRLAKAIEGVFEAIVEGTGLIDILSAGMNAAATAINFLVDNFDTLAAILIPVGVALAQVFGPAILASLAAITTAIAWPLLSAIGALTTAMLANPLGLLVAGVAAAITIIWKFREQLGLTDERLKAIGEVGSRVFTIITTAVTQMYQAVAPVIGAIYDKVVEWGTYIIDTLSPAFTAFKETVVPILEEIWDWIDRMLKGLEDLLGIIPKVQSSTKNSDDSSASKNIAGDIDKAFKKGGKDAGKEIESGMKKGGMTAAEALNKAQAGSGRGFGTALEKASANGAKMMGDGIKKGGDSTAAAITAAATVMASKFEGTGRNIYDLWNNWGEAFIGDWKTTIGDLLVEFQEAQTDLLRAQRDLVEEQAKTLRMERELMKKELRTPTPTNDGDGTKGKLTLSGGTRFSADDSLERYTNDNQPTRLTETSRTPVVVSGSAAAVPSPASTTVKLSVINQVDPNDVLNMMNSKRGKNTINNVISQSPDVLRALVS